MHRERAQATFAAQPPFADAQAWNYVRIFSDPRQVAVLAQDPLFLARGRCARAYYEFVRETQGYEWCIEMEEREQIFEQSRRDLEEQGLRLPEKWQEEVDRARSRLVYKKARAQKTIEQGWREQEQSRRPGADSLGLLHENFPARWREIFLQDGQSAVEASFKIQGKLPAAVALSDKRWRIRIHPNTRS